MQKHEFAQTSLRLLAIYLAVTYGVQLATMLLTMQRSLAGLPAEMASAFYLQSAVYIGATVVALLLWKYAPKLANKL